MGGGGVLQHPLGHEFGTAIGALRRRRAVFGDGNYGRRAIHRCRRRKQEVGHPVTDTGFDQRARRGGVVGIIIERLFNGLRHYHRSGEMNDGIDIVRLDKPRNQRLVGDVARGECNIPRQVLLHAGA